MLTSTCAYVCREAAQPMATLIWSSYPGTLKLNPLLPKTRREQKVLHFLSLLLTLRLCADNEDDQIRALVGLLQESISFVAEKALRFLPFFSSPFCEIPGS